jgi:Cytochrome c7 and related cytochrome c
MDPRSLEDRRREIAALLAAVSARAAGSPAAAQAAALEKRLAEVKTPTSSSAPAAAAAIEQRLESVEEAARIVEAGAGATAATDVDVMADRIRQQALGGADQAAIAGARSRIFERLDALEARAAAPLRARIADLRDTVRSLASSSDLGPLRDSKTRLRDRVALERTLRAQHGAVAVDAAVNRERSMARRERDARLSQIVTPAVAMPPLTDLEPARAKTALRGLLGACLACHRLDADGAAMRAVSTRSVLPAATFSHKPHLVQACDTCHGVAKSGVGDDEKGEDVNLPPVRSCVTCHDSARARADCVSCHLYHPQSAAELVRAMR